METSLPCAATRIRGSEEGRLPPPAPPSGGARGTLVASLTSFPSRPPIPTPSKTGTLLRPVPSGLSHLLRGRRDPEAARGAEPTREGLCPRTRWGRFSPGAERGKEPGDGCLSPRGQSWQAPHRRFPALPEATGWRKHSRRARKRAQAHTPLKGEGGSRHGGAGRGGTTPEEVA